MEQKRVLVIATARLYLAGITTVLLNIAELTKDHYRLTFVLGESGDPKIISKLQEIGEIHILPSRQHQLLRYLRELKKIMRAGHFEIVHIHGNTATMAFDLSAAAQCHVPKRITHRHSCAPQSKIKQKTLGKWINRLVTDPVACSKEAGEMLYSKPFTVINNCIDCERFRFSDQRRSEMRKQLGLEEKLVIGHIGRFSYEKNHERLIRIFQRIVFQQPEARLLLCGIGETMGHCKELAGELGLSDQVIFAGEIENPEDYYSAMDVFILPSTFEGFPLVGVEAQANGLPCVFSDTITREVQVTDSCRFVSLKTSDEEWAEAVIESAGHHPNDRAQAAEKVISAGYDYSTMKEQVLRLYEQ